MNHTKSITKITMTISCFLVVSGMVLLTGCGKKEKDEAPKGDRNIRIMKDVMSSQYEWIRQDLMVKWENNKKYTLEILEAMPEEHYDFVPAPGMRSFRQQTAHIGKSLPLKMEATGAEKIAEMDTTSKETIIASYKFMFEHMDKHLKKYNNLDLEKTQEAFFGETTQNRMFNLMDNHLAHHRGQLVVYLRLKGIEPPRYVGW